MQKGSVLRCLAAVLVALVVAIDGAPMQIDWTRVTPVEELDHYWARLPAEAQAYRNASRQQLGRITNGQEAAPGQFPYHALVLSEYGGLTSLCGGSVLSVNYILTAGHCVMLDQNTRAGGGTVIVGAHNRMVVEPTQQRIRFGHSGAVVHPQYTAADLRYDVAVVRLVAPMVFTDRVRPVRLPARNDQRLFDGTIGTVTGYGRTSDITTAFASILQYARNPVLSNVDCIALWNALLVQPQNVCLSGAGGRSTCNGDSGGPLTVLENGRSLQIGITSFGSGNGCTRGTPSVYARVSVFQDWIRSNTDYVDH